MPAEPVARDHAAARVPLAVVAREWTRIGLTGFGGPPAHIALLQRLVVERHGWMTAREFSDAVAACNLLPGPASTQLAIFCAYRLAGPAGAIAGGLGFVVPAVVIVLALSVVFLGRGAARLDPRRRGRRGRGGRRRRRRGRAGAARAGLGARARPRRAARALAGVSRRRGRGGRADRAVARARAARLRAARGRAARRARARRRSRPSDRSAPGPSPPRRAAGSARWRGRRSRSAPCPTAVAS